jgi:lysophospholipase L1-like esterase
MAGPVLVALGDSLTQGFQHGAIHKTAWSFPAIVARALGLEVPLHFRIPRIPGPGLPLNLEDLLRVTSEKLGAQLSTAEWVLKFPRVASDYLDDVEDYYERGGGRLPPKYRGTYHNLAVWGFSVSDSLTVDSDLCEHMLTRDEGFIEDDFLGTVSGAMYRTAQRVLNPALDPARNGDGQVQNLARIAAEEDIGVLVLWLGANDALGTVLTLELRDMTGSEPADPLDHRIRFEWNLTSARQFRDDYARLADEVEAALGARRPKVFVGNVPHVTIPPVTAGVGGFDGRYFDHYGRFFMSRENFNPVLHKSLTREDIVKIDARIDAFNAEIAAVAASKGWHLVDLCAVLDQLAVKRNRLEHAPEQALQRYYARLGITDHPLLRLAPIPSILSFQTDRAGQRIGGGLFGLDGVHPTTIGYGLIAEVFLSAMQAAGVPGADPRRVPWHEVIANDNLLQSPPRVWDDVVSVASQNATFWDLLFRVLA